MGWDQVGVLAGVEPVALRGTLIGVDVRPLVVAGPVGEAVGVPVDEGVEGRLKVGVLEVGGGARLVVPLVSLRVG